MSKLDAQRAMREARYQEAVARAAKPTAKAMKRPTAASSDAAAPDAQEQAALCGHRAISGRTCTREHGHAAKSHRYS